MKLVQILPDRRNLSYQISVFNSSLFKKKKNTHRRPSNEVYSFGHNIKPVVSDIICCHPGYCHPFKPRAE